MLRRTLKTLRTRKIIDDINNLHLLKGSSETQANSNYHEKSILKILEKNGIQKYNPKNKQSQNSITFRKVFTSSSVIDKLGLNLIHFSPVELDSTFFLCKLL